MSDRTIQQGPPVNFSHTKSGVHSDDFDFRAVPEPVAEEEATSDPKDWSAQELANSSLSSAMASASSETQTSSVSVAKVSTPPKVPSAGKPTSSSETSPSSSAPPVTGPTSESSSPKKENSDS